MRLNVILPAFAVVLATAIGPVRSAEKLTMKPPLHGSHWMAITGKPLAATAGAMMFQKGGNAVDSACAMTAAVATMWDTMSWGGELVALIHDPRTKRVVSVDAIGVAPAAATAKYFLDQGMKYPPRFGASAAVTPGVPGGIMTMLAEYGTLSLEDVLAPAIALADGYPIEQELVDMIESQRDRMLEWPHSMNLFFPGGRSLKAGEMFRQPGLAKSLRRLVAEERKALAEGKDRRQAILAANELFYAGDLARDFVAAARDAGGLITEDDMSGWKVKVGTPLSVNYRGYDVYKMDTATQGPVMLQSLNILENFDLRALQYNTTRYIHLLYQAMNLSYADRDFYYGDPAFGPVPIDGLLSKKYAAARAKLIDMDRNDPGIAHGDPYPFQRQRNPVGERRRQERIGEVGDTFLLGTSSAVAADKEGWVVSVTPSGGWVPAVVAGDTGIGLSQRMQQFVLDPADNPFNVVEPGKRPRVTITPTLVMKGGLPFLASSVQGGDTQDQNLLQFFLNIVEFGMTPQQASEAANIISYQMKDSFGEHTTAPGKILVNEQVPQWTRLDLARMGYKVEVKRHTSGPLNGIQFDRAHGTLWGASSTDGEDYGISW